MKAAPGTATELRMDWVLLVLVLLLCAIGLINLASAAAVTESRLHINQAIWMLLGAVVASAIASQDYKLLYRWSWAVYAAGCVLLLLVLWFGTTINGSRRWLTFGGASYQPSELLKLAIVFVTARYLADHERPEGLGLRDLVVPFLLLGAPLALVLRQPDLGTSIVIALIFFTMLLFERLRWSTVVVLGASLVAVLPLAWFYGLKPYQRERLTTFFNPEVDLQGSAWQVNQSRIAIGSGELLGKGWGQGTQVQSGFVPYHENDFIFAHHAEQFGFLGGVALLALYLVVTLWALRIARYGRDRFAVLVSVGVAALLFWHVAINVAMVMGALPVVGLWLPLASAGGSAVLTVMVGLGVLMSISMRRHVFT